MFKVPVAICREPVMKSDLTSVARILEIPIRNLSALVVPLVWDRAPDSGVETRLRDRMEEMVAAIKKAQTELGA